MFVYVRAHRDFTVAGVACRRDHHAAKTDHPAPAGAFPSPQNVLLLFSPLHQAIPSAESLDRRVKRGRISAKVCGLGELR